MKKVSLLLELVILASCSVEAKPDFKVSSNSGSANSRSIELSYKLYKIDGKTLLTI
ncbi:MAG: hypothetical protein ACRCTJ_00795 [Brevinema sp.]